MRYELDKIIVRIAKNGYVVEAKYESTEMVDGWHPTVEEEFITMNIEGIKGYLDNILRDRVRDV